MAENLSVLAIGDICLKNDGVEDFISEEIKNIFHEHDVVTADLGIPVYQEGFEEINKIGPYEKQDISIFERCSKVGISVARLAGNHIMDYGIKGAEFFCDQLKEAGIESCGVSRFFEKAYQPVIIGNEIKCAFFSVGESGFGCAHEKGESGYAWVNSIELERNIREVRKEVDYVFVFVHAGLECVTVPMLEWRERYRDLIEKGCDFVIATHPHIVQGIEKCGDGLIAYSLGNFAYDMKNKEHDNEWNTSIMISFDLGKNKKYNYQVYPLVYKNGQTIIQEKDIEFKKQFEESNLLLMDDEIYKQRLSEVCVNYFERHYYGYYTHGVFGSGTINYSFLYHNTGIESANYMERRALRILMQQEGKVIDENPYKKKILLWGMGKIGRSMLRYCVKNEMSVIGIVDKNEELWGNKIEGICCLKPDEAKELFVSDERVVGVVCSDWAFSEIRYDLKYKYGCKECISWQNFLTMVQKWNINNEI